MDPGRVVWLPGSGWSEQYMDQACDQVYPGSHACGEMDWFGGEMVYCCY